jgi:preprotein translocase subunit SecE
MGNKRGNDNFLETQRLKTMCAMDAKLNQPRVADATTPRTSKTRKFFGYIQELKEELRKVSWTTKDDLKFSTKAVIGTTFVLGLGIYLVDLVIKGSLDWITVAVQYIFG